MRAEDFGSKPHSIHSKEEFEVFLQKQRIGFNELVFQPSATDFPMITILVRGSEAVAHFYPDGDHPGFISVGSPKATGTSVFRTDRGETSLEVSNDAVVPLFRALDAAREFFREQKLPESLEWFEL
jgi:hypothetical protein